ncbi:hypothetical protein BS47DRAFT_1366859 [Hydnum rufescens UP504]|uniref:HNH nuclease domain-containing protein n=1 Tax=Hydnum rufescens UP504 TaxID=1448309 RepID=A0A9P6DQ81_9AGAM|nr:hypothetical protein BS47DRAFT_1366859 [Hydnum rufescens UP504]
MATLISDLDLAYNQILSASGLFIVQDSTASGHAKPTSVFVTAFLQAMLECAPPEGHHQVFDNGNSEGMGTRTPSHYSADTQNFAPPVEVELASRTKKFDDAVKEREGYHTSIYWEALEECETDEPITPVQIGHIIPLSMNSPKKATDLGWMWDVIQSYGGLQPGELTGDRINEPFNHLVFGYLEHFTFDTFWWSLIPDPKNNPPLPHHYVVKTFSGCRPISGTPKEGTAIKFVDHHNENDTEDLPNPQFLRLHAAVAGVIHMSAPQTTSGTDFEAPMLDSRSFWYHLRNVSGVSEWALTRRQATLRVVAFCRQECLFNAIPLISFPPISSLLPFNTQLNLTWIKMTQNETMKAFELFVLSRVPTHHCNHIQLNHLLKDKRTFKQRIEGFFGFLARLSVYAGKSLPIIFSLASGTLETKIGKYETSCGDIWLFKSCFSQDDLKDYNFRSVTYSKGICTELRNHNGAARSIQARGLEMVEIQHIAPHVPGDEVPTFLHELILVPPPIANIPSASNKHRRSPTPLDGPSKRLKFDCVLIDRMDIDEQHVDQQHVNGLPDDKSAMDVDDPQDNSLQISASDVAKVIDVAKDLEEIDIAPMPTGPVCDHSDIPDWDMDNCSLGIDTHRDIIHLELQGRPYTIRLLILG